MDVITKVTDPLGNITSYVYNASRQLEKKTNPDGTYTDYAYSADPNGFWDLASETSKSQGGTLASYTTYAYVYTSGYITKLTKTEKITDTTNVVTVYNYDSTGNLTSVVTDSTTSYAYNTSGTLKGTLASITDPEGKTTNFEYYDTKDLKLIKKPLLLSTGTTPTTTFTYDTAGNVKTVTDPTSKTVSYGYDDLNRLTTVTETPNYTTQFTYTPMGYLASVTDANGNTTSYEYNRKGNMTRVTEPSPNNYKTDLSYADAGGVDSLTALQNARLKTSSFTYDLAGNLTIDKSPLDYSTNYTWSQGRLASRTDATGRKTTYEYDALGRLTRRSYLDGSGTTTAYDTYTYDYLGNLTEAYSSSSGVRYVFEYDAQSRLTKVTDYRGYNLQYIYNAANTRATMKLDGSWGGNNTVSYGYDENDRLKTISLTGLANAFNFEYDDAGGRTRLTHPNGVYSLYNYYSGNKRLYQIIHYKSNQGLIESQTYQYFNNGNVSTRTRVTGSTSAKYYYYTYSNEGRLTGVTSTDTSYIAESFTYDETGNRLSGPGSSITYTYDGDDRMFSNAYGATTYDNNGNMLSRTKTVNGVTNLWTYSYDYENRLSQAVFKQNGVTKMTANYKYDALGRRVYKSTATVLPTNQTETKNYYYIYDGEDIVQERIEYYLDTTPQPLTVNTYVHGPGIDEPLYMNKVVNGVSGDYYFHADALGSVLDITDSNQNVPEWYLYKSFGEVTKTGSLNNRHTYTGRELDPETGFIYYRARYYDPLTGRFTTKDPIGFGGGVNKYVYVQNNPVNWVDPWGLEPPSKIPPGVDMKKNIERANKMSPFDFYRAVKTGGEWDYKNIYGNEYQDFGNYNYGLTGRACGFEEDTLKRAAGAYQWWHGGKAYDSSFGTPFGGAPYGDDPEDQKWIKEGIDDYDIGHYNKK